MSYQPVALFALEVSPGEIVPVHDGDLPAHIQITMAAIDPTAEPANKDEPKRATLKIVRQAMDPYSMGDSDSEDEDEDDDEDESSDEEEKPKDKKSAKASKKNEKMDVDSEDEDDEEEGSIERFVLCTLDSEKNYQQPLNITVQEGEAVFFEVKGNYTVYLTGNYVVPDEQRDDESDSDEDSEDEDYDLSPSEDELYGDSDESEDDLDDIADPRITEITSDDEKAEKKKDEKKEDKTNNKKRTAEETEDKKEEPKLSKKQLKKLKANDGKAAEAPTKPETPTKKTEGKGDTPSKKVKFAKELEQGPTPSKKDPSSKKDDKKEEKKTEKKVEKKEAKPTGPRKIGNLTIEDKKIGEGAVAKNGNKVKVRYIGKLTNGKQFDACVKGKPFQFTLGKGEVIKGWDLGIAGMAPGGERRLIVPPEMGYGNKPAGSIPKNSTLIFDVKCIGIN